MIVKTVQRIMYFIFGIFAVIGLIQIIISVCILNSNRNYEKDSVEITGTISSIEGYKDIDDELYHEVYVDFSYNGKEYKNVPLSEYDNTMYEGKKIQLLFNPEADRIVRTKSMMNLSTLVTGLIGAIFLVMGIAGMISTAILTRKGNHDKELLKTGKRIEATVESIELDTFITVNGRHPYIVICTYTDIFTGMQYRFKSKRLMRNPELVLKPGDTVDVYVNENDYSKHYVAVEEKMATRVLDFT